MGSKVFREKRHQKGLLLFRKPESIFPFLVLVVCIIGKSRFAYKADAQHLKKKLHNTNDSMLSKYRSVCGSKLSDFYKCAEE